MTVNMLIIILLVFIKLYIGTYLFVYILLKHNWFWFKDNIEINTIHIKLNDYLPPLFIINKIF